MIRHKLDIGKAVSVELPSTWLPEPSNHPGGEGFQPASERSRASCNYDQSVRSGLEALGVCRFTKRRSDWHDCMINFEIRAPVTLSKSQAEKFQNAISNAKPLTEKEALSLADPFELSHAGYRNSNVVAVNGKQSLQLNFKDTGPGPCEPLPNGGRRRPMLNSASVLLLVPTTDSQLQAIYFHADTMDNASKCANEFQKAVDSITWN